MQWNEVAALMGVDQINDTALFDVVEGAEPVKLSEAEWSISVVDDGTYGEKTWDAKIQYIPGLGGWCLDPFTPNTYDDEPDEEEAEPAKQEAPFFMVSVYLVDRAYGGPEEGGWYYDTGEPVAEEGLPLPVVCSTRVEAAERVRIMQAELDRTVNEGRPSTGSVLSVGRYEAHISRGYPKAYPSERPYYS